MAWITGSDRVSLSVGSVQLVFIVPSGACRHRGLPIPRDSDEAVCYLTVTSRRYLPVGNMSTTKSAMSPSPLRQPPASEAAMPPRERILATARTLFYRHGIHGVGVDAIAEAAGTNKMTLYRHFASKDLLIAECLRQLAGEIDAAFEAIVKAHPDDPKGQLLAWLGYIGEFKLTDRGCA